MKLYKEIEINFTNKYLKDIKYYKCYDIITIDSNYNILQKLLNAKKNINTFCKTLFEIYNISETKTPEESTLYNICKRCNIKNKKNKSQKFYILTFIENISEKEIK